MRVLPLKHHQLDEQEQGEPPELSRCAHCGKFGQTIKFDAEPILSQFVTRDGKKLEEYRRVAAIVQPLDKKELCSICHYSMRDVHKNAEEPPARCPRCGFGPLEVASFDHNGQAWFKCTRPGCHNRFSAWDIRDQPPYSEPSQPEERKAAKAPEDKDGCAERQIEPPKIRHKKEDTKC